MFKQKFQKKYLNKITFEKKSINEKVIYLKNHKEFFKKKFFKMKNNLQNIFKILIVINKKKKKKVII